MTENLSEKKKGRGKKGTGSYLWGVVSFLVLWELFAFNY